MWVKQGQVGYIINMRKSFNALKKISRGFFEKFSHQDFIELLFHEMDGEIPQMDPWKQLGCTARPHDVEKSFR